MKFAALLFLLACIPIASHASGNGNPDFTGSWSTPVSKISVFSLDLVQTGNRIEGYHTAVASSGKRIDAVLPGEGGPSITGSTRDGVAHVHFRGGYDENASGDALLTLRGDKIEWKIIKSKGVHYLPTSCVLYRQKIEKKK